MKFLNYYSLLILLFVFAACGESGGKNATATATAGGGDTESGFTYPKEEASQYLRQWVDSARVNTNLPQIKEDKFADDLFAFYSQRNYTPAWNKTASGNLLKQLQNLQQEGLNPASFPVDSLEYLRQQASSGKDAKSGARLDLLLSATYLKLADVLATGKVKPGKYYDSWYIKSSAPDTLFTHMQDAVASGDVHASLDYFRPRFDQYQKLQNHIDRYNKIVAEGGWPAIETSTEIKPGDSSQYVAALRKRLHLTGDLQTPPAQWTKPALYDSALIAAVNAYQTRNGLEVQPTITKDMITALNVPAKTRLKQIMLNLDRIRWFSSGDMPPTYVLVNIPEYRLRVVENGEEIKQMKVVVGKQLNSTPIFSDKIQYAIFSPYWNVPTSIAMDEIWPAARKNSGYLASRHFEVLDGWGDNARIIPPSQINWSNLGSYRVRQKPGPWNALGRVKFMFPNDYAIYLHDTPADHLFERQERALSHGCIRVEEPAWFADWLFPQYDRQEVKRKMSNNNRDVVSLENDIPVYIFYLTAFEDAEGRVNFREDLYQLDKKLTKQFDIIEG